MGTTQDREHQDTNDEAQTPKKCVVLLVDDQAMVAEGIRRMLEGETDIEFHYCENPKEAMERAIALNATTILQDLVMPDIDGMMLVRFYRSNPSTKGIPVIVLSTKEDPAIKSEAFSNGANDYLVKLPDKVELVARIRAHSQSYIAQQERDKAYKTLRETQKQLEKSNHKLEQSNRELHRLSSLDGLTGIANRRQFDHTLENEWQRALRNCSEISLIMIDIDYFKLYNDSHGHQAGDDCLRAVARALDAVTYRPTDLVARYGGEEFGVILPDTDVDGAIEVARKMVTAVCNLRMQHPASKVADHVMLSCGVATMAPRGQGNAHELLAAADSALYRAKENGRNRIETQSQSDQAAPTAFHA